MTPLPRFRSLPAFRQPERAQWPFGLLAMVFLFNAVTPLLHRIWWWAALVLIGFVLCVAMSWSLHREARKRR